MIGQPLRPQRAKRGKTAQAGGHKIGGRVSAAPSAILKAPSGPGMGNLPWRRRPQAGAVDGPGGVASDHTHERRVPKPASAFHCGLWPGAL